MGKSLLLVLLIALSVASHVNAKRNRVSVSDENGDTTDAFKRSVAVFNCNETTEHTAIALDETRCEKKKGAKDKFENIDLLFMPETNEHDAVGCDLTIVATGRYCGRWSIQYENIDVIDHFSLPRETCLDLHKGKSVKLETVPITIADDGGVLRPLTMQGNMGENIITHRIGTNDAAGTCAGRTLNFHGHRYESENAKLVSNLTLYTKKIKAGRQTRSKSGQCNLANQECKYPGGVIAWEDEECRVKLAFRGGAFKSADGIIRSTNDADRMRALKGSRCPEGKQCRRNPSVFGEGRECVANCIIAFQGASVKLESIEKCNIVCSPRLRGAFAVRLNGPPQQLRGCGVEARPTSSPHFFVASQMIADAKRDDTALDALIENASALAARNQARIDRLTDAMRHELCVSRAAEARIAAEKAHNSPAAITFIDPGKIAILRGELLITAMCKRTLALRRQTQKCYQDLPVSFRGREVFKHSIFHHLVESSLETPCYPPPVYEIGGSFLDNNGQIFKKYNVLRTTLPNKQEHVSKEEKIYEDVGHFIDLHSKYVTERHEFTQRMGEITDGSPASFFQRMFGKTPLVSWWNTFANVAPTIAIVAVIVIAAVLLCCCCCPCAVKCVRHQAEAVADYAVGIGGQHPPQ